MNASQGEPSQRNKMSQRRPQSKRSASVVDSRHLPNEEVNKAVDGKNLEKVIGHYNEEYVEKDMKLWSTENVKCKKSSMVGKQRKSKGMTCMDRKIPSSTPLYCYNVDESLDSSEFNRLENKKNLASFTHRELPGHNPFEEIKEEVVNSNAIKPQVRKKLKRKRIQIITYPGRRKKTKVEKATSSDKESVHKEDFKNNGSEANEEATQKYGKTLAFHVAFRLSSKYVIFPKNTLF